MNTKRCSRVILTAIAVLFTLIWTGVNQAQERPSNVPNLTLKVDVDLVLVNATVSDSEGRIVTGLEQGNFQVWEDKVEQKIVRLKVNPPAGATKLSVHSKGGYYAENANPKP